MKKYLLYTIIGVLGLAFLITKSIPVLIVIGAVVYVFYIRPKMK